MEVCYAVERWQPPQERRMQGRSVAVMTAANNSEHFTFRVGHVDDVDAIAANNIAMAKVGVAWLVQPVCTTKNCYCFS